MVWKIVTGVAIITGVAAALRAVRNNSSDQEGTPLFHLGPEGIPDEVRKKFGRTDHDRPHLD
jgi:hypothetical protein